MSSNLPKALEVCKAVWLILMKTEISIKEIDAQETELGLIWPVNECLTKSLETLFEWPSMLQLHGFYHDMIGRIYLKTRKGLGYT